MIRRALWPDARLRRRRASPSAARRPRAGSDALRGPLRIVTTGLAGLLTADRPVLPVRADAFPGLVAQIFKTAAGYPYLSVNAYNPWALVSQASRRRLDGIAVDRQWVCDSTIVRPGRASSTWARS